MFHDFGWDEAMATCHQREGVRTGRVPPSFPGLFTKVIVFCRPLPWSFVMRSTQVNLVCATSRLAEALQPMVVWQSPGVVGSFIGVMHELF